ncbi:RIMS-binding protein 2-like isoform X3 [Schistocerca gregaria]|uniref:RIMS-binding protein 2-like isoform X3 n=1 Tax=Schistocerca gregaria TaxID=7010 RepID=UPI00211E387D|nr:RIMS-binding protein 2-like isoform X3 [Schistocerca gregaria]
MREAADKRKELEREHAEALTQLREKQNEAQRLTKQRDASSREKSKSYETIEALQSKIRELEKKTELQNVRHEELLLEMASIKRSAQSANTALAAAAAAAAVNHNSPESGHSTPDSARVDGGGSAGPNRPAVMTSSALDNLGDMHQTTSRVLPHGRSSSQPGCGVAGFPSGIQQANSLPSSYPPSGFTATAGGYRYAVPPGEHGNPAPVPAGFVDSCSSTGYRMQSQMLPPTAGSGQLWKAPSMSDLAAFSRSGANCRGPLPPSSLPLPLTAAADAPGSGTHAQAGSGPSLGHHTSHPSPQQQQPGTATSSEIDRIMAKIEQDNRILAELDKTRSTIGLSSNSSSTTAGGSVCAAGNVTSGTTVPLATQAGHGEQNTLAYVGVPSAQPYQALPAPLGTQPQYVMPVLAPAAPPGPQQQTYVPTHTARLMPQIPTAAAAATAGAAAGRGGYLNGNLPPGVYSTFPGTEQQMITDSKVVDMLDIPGKGRCYVYIARYSYDPFQQSPNENPEAELPVNAGDYLLVWGTMDEDGFFDGELLDGRRGLVPSNFIQKLVGEDLLEFHQAVVQGLRDCDDSASTNVGQELEFSGHEIMPLDEGVYGKQRLSQQEYAYAELDDILEEEDEEQMGEGPALFFSVLVPAPKQLTLERQLNKSVLIGWNPPDNCPPSAIESYHVYVDGVLKTTVKATERTRALVEGVDSTRPHRISVRSVTPNRRTSRDAACTMVIGKDVPLGPTSVRASRVTSSSAVISWLPSNSNYQHVVCVNNVEVRTVKPGVYRHTITGLAPNTVYRVTVRAKNIRAPHFDEKNTQQMERLSAHIDFRTLPKGLPDPPVDIQVEPGPQDGTLLVTWLPVTINTTAPVTGYAVYADGKKVTDVDSPTGDHALIDVNKLLGLNPKQVTVRTKSRDSQSTDSVPTPIPSSALKGKTAKESAALDSAKADRDRRQRERYGSAVPPHMRHHQQSSGHRQMRIDSHGQVVIEPEENLSDKEIYPANNMNIPLIEITKDSASEGNFSEDDYLADRRGPPPRGHHGPVGATGHYDPRGVPRSHAERGRPPLLPHERGAQRGPDPHQPPRGRDRMDERDQYYMDGVMRGDPRARHAGHPAYRGPPPPGGRGPPPPRDKRTRWFVALFDYDPTTMSPNPDACEEELPFSEGDTIKVYGEKDADGFYWGECRGRRGYVPHNMVVEVQDMPKNSIEPVRGQHPHPSHGPPHSRDRWGDIYANMPVKKMIALYDYDPQELSPNVDAEVELSFNTGNIIYVYGEMDDDGFYMGELDGVRGLVPSNFLTEAPADYEDGSGPPRQQRLPPQDHRGSRPVVGHGPGARGPPPPPRDARDRRKAGSEVERRPTTTPRSERW